MKCVVGPMLVLLLALPAAGSGDKPQEDKPPPSPRQQLDVLRQDFFNQQRQVFENLRKEFAAKFYKLAEDNPKDPAALDALTWVLQNGAGSPVFQKAMDKMAVVLEGMPLKDVAQRLRMLPGSNPRLAAAVFQRAEKDQDNPLAADLIAWVALNNSFSPLGQKALDRLLEKYPNNAAIERMCQLLANSRSPGSADKLKAIVDKSANPRVKAAAALRWADSWWPRPIISATSRRRPKRSRRRLRNTWRWWLILWARTLRP